jgi:hypothetical protein
VQTVQETMMAPLWGKLCLGPSQTVVGGVLNWALQHLHHVRTTTCLQVCPGNSRAARSGCPLEFAGHAA